MMQVICITGCSFPDKSMASGNRLLHIMRMLKNGGADVTVLTSGSDTGKRESIIVDGIPIRCLVDFSGNRLLRMVRNYFVFPLRVLVYVFRHRSKPTIIYDYVGTFGGGLQVYLITRLFQLKICKEKSELPYSIFLNKSKASKFIEINIASKFYDCMVVMTQNLVRFYDHYTRKNCPKILIPMSVDWNLFAYETRENPFPFEYIAYTGNMYRIGGGVDVLVKAFGKIAKRFPTLRLVLIGNGDARIKQNLSKLLDSEVAKRLVFLFGANISRADMPQYTKNAKILAMLPLPTKQQEGCFPTKLGEYMSSGVPTVISRVGNPISVLTNGENIVYVPPNDPDATAEAFARILENYPKALEVAAAGQRFAKEKFHYNNSSQRLTVWMKERVGE